MTAMDFSLRHFASIACALDNARAYFAFYADTDDDGAPNKEMELHDDIEQAQAALQALRAEAEPDIITLGR